MSAAIGRPCQRVQSAWAARGFACLRVCCSGWVVFSRRLLAWCYVRFSCTPRFVAGRVVGEGVMTRHHVRTDGSVGRCDTKEGGRCKFAREGALHFESAGESHDYAA